MHIGNGWLSGGWKRGHLSKNYSVLVPYLIYGRQSVLALNNGLILLDQLPALLCDSSLQRGNLSGRIIVGGSPSTKTSEQTRRGPKIPLSAMLRAPMVHGSPGDYKVLHGLYLNLNRRDICKYSHSVKSYSPVLEVSGYYFILLRIREIESARGKRKSEKVALLAFFSLCLQPFYSLTNCKKKSSVIAS